MAHPLDNVVQHIRRVAANQGASDGELLQSFVTANDQAAFASLVKRHGKLVLAVCRRKLGNLEDAEDAFQATFVILARKAAKLPQTGSLASWLHSVAYRIAISARRLAARRSRHERKAKSMVSTNPASDATWREVQLLLDEEIQRLPERYREPFILCCLESQSYAAAAQQMGVKESTVHGRLTEARKRLQARLSRRGVELTAVLGAAALAPSAATAQVPSALVVKAVSAATSAALPASVTALVKGVTASLAIKKAKVMVALFFAFSAIVGTTSMWAFQQQPGGREKAPGAQAAGKQDAAVKAEPAVAKDIYGDPLPPGAVARIATVRFRHSDHISFLALAPDGEFIVSQARDGIRVWDTKTGKELRHFPHLGGDITRACDLSPDGKLLAAQGKNTDLFALWDIASGRKLRDLGVVRYGNMARFSPDGKYLLTYGSDGDSMATLWDVATGKALRSWSPHENIFFSATFTGDSKTLITAISGQVRFWDVATGMQTREFSIESDSFGTIAASPDGKLLATVGTMVTAGVAPGGASRAENTIRIWDIALGKEVRTINVPENKDFFFPASINNFRFTPDGKRIVTSGMSSALRFWDVATGKELPHIPLDCYGSGHLTFSRDGKKLATAAAMLTIRLFDLPSGKDLAPPGEHQLEMGGLAFSASGRNLAIVGDHSINVWDPTTGQQRFQMHAPNPNTRICLTADGRTLYSAGLYKGIHAWDMETGKKLREYENVPLSGAANLALAPDGTTLAVAIEKSVVLLDTRTGRKLQEFTGHETLAVAFCASGKKLMGWNGDEKFYMWDLTSGKRSTEYPFPKDIGPLGIIAIAPDSRLIALAGRNKDLLVLDMETGRDLAYAVDLPDAPCFGAFSPDGRALAWAGSTEPPVRVMEIASRKERRHFLGHKGRVGALAYSADGGMLASGGIDTTALVWDVIGKNAKKTSPLTDQDIGMCWDDLAGEDAAKAFNAILKLAADPARAISFLDKRLEPVPNVGEKDLAKLITDLGSDAFAVREAAARRLEKLGDVADLACRKALEMPATLEVRRRLENLLEKYKQQSRNPAPELIRSLRALEALELAGTLKAREVLTNMSTGASQARLTMDAKAALERLRKRN